MRRARGFTLIELVVVIVLLGITAVTMSLLFTGSVSGYIDTSRRADSAASARVALDRMGRELREAMPLSIRVSNGCIQFLPILGGSIYTNFPVNTTAIPVLDFSWQAASPMYAAIYPVTTNELYSLQSMRLISSIGAASSSARTITLSSTSTYLHQSPAERVYILGNPVSYCLQSGAIYRYQSTVTATQPAPAALGTAALLIDNLDLAKSSFNYSLGNWNANGLVGISLNISRTSSSGAAEPLALDHAVWIRNVQ